MVFLLQPRPIMADRNLKPVAPSLLSDPAFSTDPSAHPYAVRTSHEPWLSSPPAGHPKLKSKSRRRRSGDDSASDSEPFHIIPPPNSPVNFGLQNTTPFSVPQRVVTETVGPHSQSTSALTTAAEPLSARQSHPNLSPAPITTAPPPATPRRRRITLMTILKRRATQQPQSTASANSVPRKALNSSKSLSNKSDVTRTLAQPNRMSNEGFPPNPVTLGNSVPSMPSTIHPTPTQRVVDIPANRLENLDRIDELDETNPWGIGFHHGGPYEAAVEAIRGKGNKVFPGHGSYNRGAPHFNDNVHLSLSNLHPLLTSSLGLFPSSGNWLVSESIAWSDSPEKLPSALYHSSTATPKL